MMHIGITNFDYAASEAGRAALLKHEPLVGESLECGLIHGFFEGRHHSGLVIQRAFKQQVHADGSR